MSTQIDLGPVLSIPKGDWNASTTYERLNLVRHNSAAWICNVDTSIGVEPSEDSVDWFLQVKDTSAVSSVNGMRGDVEITTTQTPSNDSNDTSIANTEWVRDRIDETINSTHSYTDSAISTATTSILDTAAQDAANKATTAVNQALAASEIKFATKEIVNNLAGNISTLTESNAAQDKAISSAQNSANTASQQIGVLDSTLRTLIEQEVAKCVKLSGSAVTGNNFNRNDDDSYIYIAGGTGTSSAPNSGALTVWGKDHTYYPGCIALQANNGTASNELKLFPNGRATLAGSDILTSVGGSINGPIKRNGGDVILNENTNGAMYISGGVTRDTGSHIMLKPQSHSNKGGELELVAVTQDGEQAVLNLRGNGYATIKGLHLVRVVNGVYADESGSLNITHNSNGSMFVTANNITVLSASGTSSLRLPSGGKWKYFYITRTSNGNLYSCDTGQTAGGTIIGTPPSGGSGRAIAIRVE